MKTKRIKHLNELYKVPISKPTKIKRNTLKSVLKRVLKRVLLHPFTIASSVYLLIILSIIILTLKL